MGVRWKAGAIIVALVITMACSGGKEGGFKSPTNPGTPTPTVSLASLANEAARAMFPVGSTVRRVDTPAVRVYSEFSEEDTLAAIRGANWRQPGMPQWNNWEGRTGRFFILVSTKAEADILIIATATLHQGVAAEKCGSAVPSGSPAIIGGEIRIATGLKAGCEGGLRSEMSHELGHILGFGHSPEGRDEMSPSPLWNVGPTPTLDDASRWYYTATVGALIVQ